MNQELEMKFQELTDFGKLECGFRSDWLSGNEKTSKELADLKEKAMYSKSESEIQSILKQADQLVKDACSVYLAETPKRLTDEISQNQNTLHDATICPISFSDLSVQSDLSCSASVSCRSDFL